LNIKIFVQTGTGLCDPMRYADRTVFRSKLSTVHATSNRKDIYTSIHNAMRLWDCSVLTPALQQMLSYSVDCVWNVMAHTQKPDFVFRGNGRVRLNRQGRQFSRLLAAEVCASVVVMIDTLSSEVVWRVLATHSIRQVPLHFPSRASPCAITFQLDSTTLDPHSLATAIKHITSTNLPTSFPYPYWAPELAKVSPDLYSSI
jgi:hypothetical protein